MIFKKNTSKTSTITLKKEDIKNEINAFNSRQQYRYTLISTILMILIIVAASLLIAMFIMPVFQVYGTTMEPTMYEGDIVLSVKNSDIKNNDIVAFYHDNKLLIKRVIASPGDVVNIDRDGMIYVNSKLIDSICNSENHSIDSDINYPYNVPENSWFVVGDDLSVSADSRNSNIGCVSEEEIIGKIVFRIWPLKSFGEL